MADLLKKILKPNIQTKMILFFLAIALIPLLILSIIINSVFSKYIISILTSNLTYSSERINDKFQEYLASLDKMTLDIVYNEFIQSSLQGGESDSANVFLMEQYLSRLYTEYVHTIIYIDNKGRVFNTDKNFRPRLADLKKSKIYSKIINTYGKLTWTFNKDDLNPADNSNYIFAGRYVRNLSLNVPPGILILKINPKVISNLFIKKNTEPAGSYMLCDPAGRIVFTTGNKKMMGDYISDRFLLELIKKNKTGTYVGNTSSGKYLVTYDTENNANWSILGLMPYSAALHELTDLQKISALLTLFFIILTIFSAIFYSLSFTKPIKEIVNSMRKVRKGNFSVKIEEKRQDEIGELIVSFNKMSSDIQALLKKVEQDQQDLKISELNSLIHQINPHFLYNTLDNINMLAKLSQEKRISDLITALSKLLRISLSGGKGIITVNDEIEHIRNYLLIQKMRYGNLFDFTIHIDEKIGDQEVIKLILQPLVENAISHGFKNVGTGGSINVKARTEPGFVIFEVLDNGCGLSDDKLHELNGQKLGDIPMNENLKTKGYGIRNLNTRLWLYYGNEYGVTFANLPGCGTAAQIVIPIYIK